MRWAVYRWGGGRVVLVVALLLAACGGAAEGTPTSAPVPTVGAMATLPTGATAMLAHTMVPPTASRVAPVVPVTPTLSRGVPQSCRAEGAATAATAVAEVPGGLRQVVAPAQRANNFAQLVQFSPDGRWLAVGGADAVLLYERATLVLRWRCATGVAVTGLAFSPDGAFLTAGLTNNQLPLWQVSDGQLVRVTTSLHNGAAVGFSPDGTLVITGYGIWVYAWRMSDGKLAHDFVTRSGALGGMAIGAAADGTRVVMAIRPPSINSTDAQPVEVYVRRLEDGGVLGMFTGPYFGVMALTGAGPTAAVLDSGGLKLWQLAEGVKPYPVQGTAGYFPNSTSAVVFSSDGTVLTGGTDRGQVLLWAVSSGALLASYQLPRADFICVAIDPTNQSLAALDRSGGLWLWWR